MTDPRLLSRSIDDVTYPAWRAWSWQTSARPCRPPAWPPPGTAAVAGAGAAAGGWPSWDASVDYIRCWCGPRLLGERSGERGQWIGHSIKHPWVPWTGSREGLCVPGKAPGRTVLDAIDWMRGKVGMSRWRGERLGGGRRSDVCIIYYSSLGPSTTRVRRDALEHVLIPIDWPWLLHGFAVDRSSVTCIWKSKLGAFDSTPCIERPLGPSSSFAP